MRQNFSSFPMITTHLQTMRALLAKDWRFFQVPMLALIVSGATCYILVIGGSLFFTSEIPRMRYADPEAFHRWLIGTIDSAAALAILMAVLVASAFGGIALAAERADRTADFIGLLPVTRPQIILSKWLVTACMLGGCILFHALVIGTTLVFISDQHHSDSAWAAAMIGGEILCMFGAAWMVGALVRSGPISACAGIAVTAIVTVLAAISIPHSMHSPGAYSDHDVFVRVGTATVVIGLCTILAGTTVYLRRISP